MLPKWEDICAKFRSIFDGSLDEEHAGAFLIDLHPIYRAATDGVALVAATDLDLEPYRRHLTAVTGYELGELVAISTSDPDACPAAWRQAIHADALVGKEAMATVVKSYFDDNLHQRCQIPIIRAAMADGSIGYDRVMLMTRSIRYFMMETLNEMFSELPPIWSRAVDVMLRTHLWASFTKDRAVLADLEPMFLYLLKAPPIGQPVWSPKSYLILVR